ncbi:hypothetical protein Moror_5069 [Moniliophthora roreri MCA 2997]|uniref:F-box domain-containing protein n=1 Tax=Moniliophthora roreri (strain MCA 2997) TaxID=1381753 RepID=V2X1I6_MONRO|nr:hypothetical protein Moror_5069 [Moniliophthora roreri MCA 2997]
MGKKGSPASRSKENKSPKAPVITKSTPNLFSILFCEKCINDDFASASYPDPDQEQRFLSLAEATEAVAFLKEEKRELASCDEKISRLHQAMDQYESEKLSHEGRFPSGTKTNGASTRILSRSIRCQRCNNEVTTFSYSGPIQIQAVYDEKILLTVRLLAQVEAQRVALQIRTHARRPAISRSQRRGLPIVLWKAIFSEVIRNSDGTDDSLILGAGSSSASLILSHVCSDWRAMAHLHPVLWRTISVWLSMLKKDYTMLLGTFLRYSKEMPLRVRMFDARWPGHRSSWPRVGDNGNRAFTLLMTQASRIEALELMLFDWNILTQWKQRSISFPILREFSALNQWDVVYQDTLSWFWDPVMQRIWGKHEWVTDRTKADVIRMTPQHETVVVAKAMEFRQLLQLLQGSRVTSLTVEDLTKGYGEFQEDRADGSPKRVEVQFLEDIDIHVSDPSTANNLFSILVLPRLKELQVKLRRSKRTDTCPFTTLAPMLSRSTWLLSKLVLDVPNIYLSDHTLADILRETPYLRILCVMTVTRTPGRIATKSSFNFFTSLRLGPNDSAHSLLIPRLQELYLTEDGLLSDAGAADELLKVVEFRSTSGLAARGRAENDISVLHRVVVHSICRNVGSPDTRCEQDRCQCNFLLEQGNFERIQALVRDFVFFGYKFTYLTSEGV